MEKITTAIIAYNEERNIEDCIQSVLPFSDEILIVDSESTDKTIEIAKKYNCRIIIQPFLGHVQQKNFALEKAKNDWVFSLDADERATQELQNKINELKQKGLKKYAYSINRLNFYLFTWFKYGGWYPDKKIRLVNKKFCHWKGENPHDSLRLKIYEKNQNEHLHLDILHYTYRSLEEHLNQIQKFSTIAASQKAQKKIRFITPRLFFHPFMKFIKTYFIQKAFLKGSTGFVFSIMATISVFMKYAKLWEIKKKEKMGAQGEK